MLYDKQPTGQNKSIKRFGPQDFTFNDDHTCICPAGLALTGGATIYLTSSALFVWRQSSVRGAKRIRAEARMRFNLQTGEISNGQYGEYSSGGDMANSTWMR